MKKILTIDIGTQSLKGSIIDQKLKTKDRFKVGYKYYTLKGDKVEINVEKIWDAFLKVTKHLDIKDIEGICFSSLCPSLLVMSQDGNALAPVILHLDRRSQFESDWIVKNIGIEEFKTITGNPPIAGGISVTSILWLKNNHPELVNRSNIKFGHVSTYFLKKLTGKFLIDPSNASFTGLYETRKYGGWSKEILNKTGINENCLPEIADSFSIAGFIDAKVSGITGIKKGTPVIMGANDTTCAVTGAGIKEPGLLLNTSGTVEILVLCSDKPIIGKNHLLRTHAYKNRWLLMRTLGAGGASIEWFRQNFCKEMSKKYFYDEYFKNVLDKGKDKVFFEPYLSGDRHKIEKMTASFKNISLDTKRDDFLYAIASNNIKYQAQILDEWKLKENISKKLFHVGGGASTSYTKLKQKILPEYTFVEFGETAERGAAIIGFETLGIDTLLSEKEMVLSKNPL